MATLLPKVLINRADYQIGGGVALRLELRACRCLNWVNRDRLAQAAGPAMSAMPRYCCKSRFAQVIKNSAGCRRVFGVKMWGDMSPRVKLTGDFGNAIEGIRISNRLPPLVFAKNSWRCNFRLLQQYRPKATELPCGNEMTRCAKRSSRCERAMCATMAVRRRA